MAFKIPIGTPVSEVAAALGDFAQLGEVILQIWDSPAMVARRDAVAAEQAKVQAAKDFDEAMKSGDLTKVDEDLS